MEQNYVCGFMFNPEKTKVVLILKSKPRWQLGCLNGVGGKIEPYETALMAMKREFLEETGTFWCDWQKVISLAIRGANIHFFCTQVPEDVVRSVRSTTSEEVLIVNVMDVVLGKVKAIDNLPWLIMMASYRLEHPKVKVI